VTPFRDTIASVPLSIKIISLITIFIAIFPTLYDASTWEWGVEDGWLIMLLFISLFIIAIPIIASILLWTGYKFARIVFIIILIPWLILNIFLFISMDFNIYKVFFIIKIILFPIFIIYLLLNKKMSSFFSK
jgi:hypothetical protein